MKRGGAFIVKDGVLVPVDTDAEKAVAGLEGQAFAVTLDDERPVNDRRRAALFAWLRDWRASLPDSFNRNFWRNFFGALYCPADEKTILDFLKKVHGTKSLATGKCSDAQLADFFRFVQERCDEIKAMADAAERDAERERGGSEW